MVCEICGSRKFKKENGIFACLECGTEYSADEAKKLLVEVNESSDTAVNNDEVAILLTKLQTWLEYVLNIENLLQHFNISIQDYFKTPLSISDFREKIKYPTPEKLFSRLQEKDFYYEYIVNSSIGKNNNPFKKTPIDSFTINYLKWYFSEKEDYSRLDSNLFLASTVNGYGCDDLTKLSGFVSLFYEVQKAYDSPTKRYVFCNQCNFINKHSDNREIYTTEKVYGFLGNLKGERKVIIAPKYDVNSVLCHSSKIFENFKTTYVNHYNDMFANDDLINCLVSLKAEKDKYVKMFDLPSEYCNIESLTNMINNLIYGKAQSWKEIALLEDKEIRTNKFISRIDNLEGTIKDISVSINTKLSQLSVNLDSINSNLQSFRSSLSSIAMNSASMNQMLAKDTFYQKMITWSVI